MMKKMATVAGTSLCVFVVLAFLVAGRSLHEIRGLARAGADVAADELTATLGDQVRDRKLEQEVSKSRNELIERQTQIIAFRPQISELESVVSDLTSRTERRARLLAEAFPVLKKATDSDSSTVRFANEDRPIGEFQSELDELLALQQREQRQREVRQAALDRLRETVSSGESAVAEMQNQIEEAEHRIALLRSRREQAKLESETLNLVAAATADRDSVVGMMSTSLVRLEKEVEELESRNEARRNLATNQADGSKNRLSAGWDRLQRLESMYQQAQVEGGLKTRESIDTLAHVNGQSRAGD